MRLRSVRGPLRNVTFARSARPVWATAGGDGGMDVSKGSELTITKATAALLGPNSCSAWVISLASTGQMSSHAELKKARTVTLPGAYGRVQGLPLGSCREIAGARLPASWLSPMNAFRDALTGGALGGAGAGGGVSLVPARVVGGVAISALTPALPMKSSTRTPPTARTANPAMIQWMNFRGTGTDPARSAAPRSIGTLPVANAVARSSGERCA